MATNNPEYSLGRRALIAFFLAVLVGLFGYSWWLSTSESPPPEHRAHEVTKHLDGMRWTSHGSWSR